LFAAFGVGQFPEGNRIALAGLVAQINAMVTYGQGQVVVWTLRSPNAAELVRLEQQLGPAIYNQVKFINGIEGLYQWLQAYFRT